MVIEMVSKSRCIRLASMKSSLHRGNIPAETGERPVSTTIFTWDPIPFINTSGAGPIYLRDQNLVVAMPIVAITHTDAIPSAGTGAAKFDFIFNLSFLKRVSIYSRDIIILMANQVSRETSTLEWSEYNLYHELNCFT